MIVFEAVRRGLEGRVEAAGIGALGEGRGIWSELFLVCVCERKRERERDAVILG